MTMTRIDYLQRELQVMNEQKALIKKQRNDLERIQFADIQWLKIRLTDGVLFSEGTRYDLDFT